VEDVYDVNASDQGQPTAEYRNARSVWTIPVKPVPGAHFAVMPEALVQPCIFAGCPPGGVVVDPFAGSGTVGLVASQLQRNAILIDLNPDYIRMAKRRIQRHAGFAAGVDWSYLLPKSGNSVRQGRQKVCTVRLNSHLSI